MNMKIILYSLGVWFIFIVLAIVNGAVREKFYSPKVGELKGHQISTFIFICIIINILIFA